MKLTELLVNCRSTGLLYSPIRMINISYKKSHYFRRLRSSYPRCFVKKNVLKYLTNFTGRHLCWILFLIILTLLYWKANLTQTFYCKICEVFNDTYYEEHLRTTASKGATSILYSDLIDFSENRDKEFQFGSMIFQSF